METLFYNTLLNGDGTRMSVTLSPEEACMAQDLQAEYQAKKARGLFKNALGYEASITTLTTIIKRISEQKYFELPPADYVPVRVGEGAWSSSLLTYRTYSIGDDFSTGVINTGGNNSRTANIEAGIDSLVIPVNNWAKSHGWSIIDLEQASKSGNWDLVSAKEKARLKNWQLGIQKVAFLGLANNASCLGLLNQPTTGAEAVNVSGLLTNSIGSLAGSNGVALSAFLGALLNEYRQGANRTVMPNRLTIPETDYLSLAIPTSPQFPLKSILQLMTETLSIMTKQKDFQILPCSYGDDTSVAGTGQGNTTGSQIYAMYRHDEESIRMDIPVDYTSTLANSIDNFSFQNTGYGQFTGVKMYQPKTLMYLTFPASNLGSPPL